MQNLSNSNKQNQKVQNVVLDEHAPKLSIQDAFKKFQKQKFYQLKLNKYLKNVQIDRKNLEFKQQLREKFIQTAKKYIGVPYAKKYHEPGDKLYNAPLFLDCCALVRQCIFDLRQDFGYTLAKWNQSYQFDLLPDEGLQEKDLVPGDIIFYSATYNNPKLKPFPHSMVHVQIYMGQGKSIGARWQKGAIQIFDSYKFQSKLYHSVKHHYRSINSWLQGKFQSHCSEHKWLDQRANQWLSDKYSVFADPTLDDINLMENQKKDIVKDIMIGKGNNCKLIKQYFSNTEKYRIMNQKQTFSPHYYYKWVQSTGQIDFYTFKQGEQLVNHIPNISVISSKLQLLKTLKEMQIDLKTKQKPQNLPISQFIPKTYRLDVMSDQIQFLNDQTEGIWIYKPRNLNQGRGIKMIGNVKEFKEEFIRSKKFYLGEFSLNNMIYFKPELNPTIKKQQVKEQNVQSNESSKQTISNQNKYSQLKHDGLIQHYVKPLLLNGKKFDIRCYMFVYSNPLIVFFHTGYLRLCIQNYNEQNLQDQKNLMIHLTNNCFQNKHKDYKLKKQDTIQDWGLIEQTIGKEKTQTLKHQIKRILLTTFAAAKRKLMLKKGTYELLGCDVIVDQNYKPYLLQVNTNPALFTDTQTQKKMLPQLVHKTLDISFGLFQGEDPQYYAQNCEKFNYELLFCEKTGFYYNLENQKKTILKEEKGQIIVVNGIQIQKNQKVCKQLSPNQLNKQY